MASTAMLPGSASSAPQSFGEVSTSPLLSARSLGSSRPHTMGSAWAMASRCPLGRSFRACSSSELPSLPSGFGMGQSSASTATCFRSTIRNETRGTPRKVAIASDNETLITAGDYVVDVCSGRRALVLGSSNTHCKVRFDVSSWGVWCEGAGNDAKPEIVPVGRLHLWSERWEGQQRPQSQNPNLKAGFRSSATFGVVHDSVSFNTAQPSPRALPALLVCRAAQQALVPKPSPKRVLPITPRSARMFQDWDEEEDSLEKTGYAKKTANLSMEIDDDCTPQDEGDVLLSRFKVAAKARFGGSLGAAWHAVLDVRGTGKVGYLDFVRGGRVLGFSGNYRKLWAALTKDGTLDNSGLIGFEMLDPVGAKIIEDFRSCLLSRGTETLDDIWEKYLDLDGSGRCSREEFMLIMIGLGWSKSTSNRLFRMLDVGGQQDLSLDELEIIGLPRRQVLRNPTGRELLRIRDEQARERVLSDFHGYLMKTFGCVVRGWRLGLDSDGDGKLRFTEFCHAMKEIGFKGPLQTLWRGLDKKKIGYVELSDLDPEANEQIDEFRTFLEENYRTLEDVWERVFDVDSSGRCTLENFVNVCRSPLKWPGNARRMFKWLDLHGRNVLTLDQIDFLGMRRRVVNAAPSAREKIAERQAKDRAEADAVFGRFKDYLHQRSGNLVRAWHHDLDPQGDKRLQFTEFCASCRRIGFQGNLKALWMSLDPNETGYIGLADLDHEAVEHLDDFCLLFRTFFENLDIGWYRFLDPDLSGRCSPEEFRQACTRLGFRRNIHQLFKYLDVMGEGSLELDMLKHLELPRAPSREVAMKSAKEVASKDLEQLKKFLKLKAGSLAIAWRQCFCTRGVDGQLFERVAVDDFIRKCRSFGFEGDFPQIWAELALPSTGFSDLRTLALDYHYEPVAIEVFPDMSPKRSSRCSSKGRLSGKSREHDATPRSHRRKSTGAAQSPRRSMSEAEGLSKAQGRKKSTGLQISRTHDEMSPTSSVEVESKPEAGNGSDSSPERSSPSTRRISFDAESLANDTRDCLSGSEDLGNTRSDSKARVAFESPSAVDSLSNTQPPVARSNTTGELYTKRKSLSRMSLAKMQESLKEKAKRAPLDALDSITLGELDPEAFAELLSFRALCAANFGTHEDTWRALLKECVQTNFDARLRKVEFCQALHMIGFTGDAQIIFETCDIEQANKISGENLRFLQIGL